MFLAVKFIFGSFLLFVGVTGLLIAARILRSDRGDWERNRRRSRGLREVMSGNVSARPDGYPDGVCHEAMAVKRVKGKASVWAPQAALTEEAVDDILSKKTK
jgi:hypothetical protein